MTSKALTAERKEIRGRGRPELYTPEVADEVCDRLADGQSLRAICKYAIIDGQRVERTGETWFPAPATVCLWMEENTHGFSERYARVRLIGYDQMALQTLEIADETTVEEVSKARLRVDARKWFLSKVDPLRYGDRLTLAGDDDNPVKVELDHTTTARRVAFILAQGQTSDTSST